MIYIGIDPGQNGGYALISKGGAETWPWDDREFILLMNEYYESTDEVVAVVEKVNAMPGQGVTSMFQFGKSAGFIEGVLRAYGIPYQLVPPRKWKKEFSLGSDKAQSIEVCKRLFPNVDLRRTERCKKDNDGMAEALLMAEYGRRKF